MEEKRSWIVKLKIISRFGVREQVIGEYDDRDYAEKVAEVLQECADSNPRSNAIYWVEPK